jgi:hypothetical protein
VSGPSAKLPHLVERIRALVARGAGRADGAARRRAGGRAGAAARRGQATVDRDELKRRCNLLASRAETGGAYGRLICGFCGKQKSGVAMPKHLATVHGEEIAALPARIFPKFNA